MTTAPRGSDETRICDFVTGFFCILPEGHDGEHRGYDEAEPLGVISKADPDTVSVPKKAWEAALDAASDHMPEAVTNPSDDAFLVCSCGKYDGEIAKETWWEHVLTALKREEGVTWPE